MSSAWKVIKTFDLQVPEGAASMGTRVRVVVSRTIRTTRDGGRRASYSTRVECEPSRSHRTLPSVNIPVVPRPKDYGMATLPFSANLLACAMWDAATFVQEDSEAGSPE